MSVTAHGVAYDALQIATDHGTRRWMHEPDVRAHQDAAVDIIVAGTTYRIRQDDNTIALTVFVDGLITDEAQFSAGLAHLASRHIGEALR